MLWAAQGGKTICTEAARLCLFVEVFYRILHDGVDGRLHFLLGGWVWVIPLSIA